MASCAFDEKRPGVIVDPSPMPQCPTCQSYNEEAAAFCSQCGSSLEKGNARRRGRGKPWLRLSLALLVLAALIAVLIVAYYPEGPSTGAGGPASSVRRSSGRDSQNSKGPPSSGGYSLVTQPADDEPQPLDLEKVGGLVRQALVILELRGETGRPLREERGLLVDATGVILTRYRPLLGAYKGTCRLPSPGESRVEITGLSYRDEALDLALLRISRSPEGYPAVPLLSGFPTDVLGAGDVVFVFNTEQGIESALAENYHVCSDGIARLRITEKPEAPPDTFLAVDVYGYAMGLCRPEVDGRVLPTMGSLPSRDYRILVDAASSLVASIDREALVSLYDLTRRYYEGTFDDLFVKGTVALKQTRWREAVDFLEQALDRVAVDRPDEADVSVAVRELKESYLEETKRLVEGDRLEEATLLVQAAVTRFPGDSALLVRLGEIRFLRKDWAGGVQVLLRARQIESSPRVDSLLEGGYLQLAAEAAKANDVRAQQGSLLAGIQELPTSAKLRLELANLYIKLGAYNDATALLSEVKELSESLREIADSLLVKIDDLLKRRYAVIIPFDPESRSIRTTATIDGIRDMTFIIDTGATYTTIPAEVARELGYDVSLDTDESRNHSIVVDTAAGRMVARRILVQSVNVGGYIVPRLEVLVFPQVGGQSFGLLGLNFLKHFKYTVDASKKEFRLERS